MNYLTGKQIELRAVEPEDLDALSLQFGCLFNGPFYAAVRGDDVPVEEYAVVS